MRLINAGELKEDLFIKFGNQLPNGLLEEIDNVPTVNKCDNCDLMLMVKTRGEKNEKL